LRLISYQPTYGYKIIRELEARSKGYFQFKEGTLYPALHRMEKEGLIEGSWRKLPNGLERRYYYITAKGRKVLADRMAVWHNFTTAVDLIIQTL
jgi:DNA-binding PadR family transcriptional regulator